ncbi:uncharacterized protein LOC124648304 [Lolium rigidum]|uniref:uncharacterized protein LOC124648304 n=1 Tax=Lolium rigidum TaxID=89674 RepID=UPI001F5CB468|nr:uncharacterized protein LOC124648304 [Lolium rigidum]
MALRNLAAAALRLPPPALRVSPSAAGTRTSFYTTFQGRPTSLEKMRYEVNLQTLDGLKELEEHLKRHVQILEFGRKCLSWSFKLLMPIPMAAAILKWARQ